MLFSNSATQAIRGALCFRSAVLNEHVPLLLFVNRKPVVEPQPAIEPEPIAAPPTLPTIPPIPAEPTIQPSDELPTPKVETFPVEWPTTPNTGGGD